MLNPQGSPVAGGRQVQSLGSLGAFPKSLPSINLDELEFALIDLTLGA